MSHTTAALLSRGQFIVAIAGATGRLGDVATRTLLSPPFRPHFPRILALTRSASSEKSKSLATAGAEVVEVAFEPTDGEDNEKVVENLASVLKGVDVVINVLGGEASARSKDNVAAAAVKAGARVYFPSEFGVDHRLNDFGDFENKEWIKKQEHLRYVQKISEGKDLKIVSVYTGLFLELSFGPWFGFNFTSTPPTLTSIGPTTIPTAYTSTTDVGRSLAQLSILALSNPDRVPANVRIQGSARSYEDVARALEKVKGLKEGEVKVVSLDLGEEREKLRKEYLGGEVTTPVTHIRVLMGEGRLDFSSDNQNELVNPREAVWKWASVEDYLASSLAIEK